MNTHDVSTVIHVLLQILFLEERDTCWAYLRHPKCIYMRAAFRHWPGTQTRASGTCRCGWCHEEWRYLRASGPSAETLQERSEMSIRCRRCEGKSNSPGNCRGFTNVLSTGWGEDPLIGSVPSLMAVQGAPSSCSSRISFRATKLSVNLLRPLKTVA